MTIHILNFDSEFYRTTIATKKEVRAIIRHLNDLASGKVKPDCKTCGLCRELKVKFNVDDIRSYIATWPKLYTEGNSCTVLPVADSKGNYWPLDKHGTHKSMWDGRTKIGKLRKDLCRHIAVELQAELAAGVYE